MASAEEAKKNSQQLRGTIKQTLESSATHFSDDDEKILKHHGIYGQDDRDQRLARIRAKADPAYSFMVRTKLPGGHITADQYLALDHLAMKFANSSLRITTRQDIQFHTVLKGNLRSLIAGINAVNVTTFGGCGDVARNVVATPAPFNTPACLEVQRLAQEVSAALLPRTRAYVEIWFNGKPIELTPGGADAEPLYGEVYLPRKFKTGIVIPPRNDVDIYSHDLGFAAHCSNGKVDGYTVLVGGGQGMDHGKLATYPYLAKPIIYIRPEQVVKVAAAVLSMHRDFGDRTNRKHARIKYVIAERGVEWFRAELASRLWAAGKGAADPAVEDPKELNFTTVADILGWNEQGDGKSFCGVRVENGRIKNYEKVRYTSAFRAIFKRFQCPARLTPNQNVLFCNLAASDRKAFDAILLEYGVPPLESYSAARRMSIACVALPTCGLSLSESERVFPAVMDGIDKLLKELGLEEEPILFRMTGCPNGCARPYNADFGFVGRGIGKYALYIGGSNIGDRLGGLAFKSVAIGDIPAVIKPILADYVANRRPKESFSAYWGRTQVNGPAPHSSQFHVELAERAKRLALTRSSAPGTGE